LPPAGRSEEPEQELDLMPNIRRLLTQLAAHEAQLSETQFLAPCVRGGKVRTRVAGLVYTFRPEPSNFEGWGIFQPISSDTARLMEEADLPAVASYLKQFPVVRLRLGRALQGQNWLAYPVNEGDARQRWGAARPVPVHLVTEGAPFEPVVARWDGAACWFEEVDRRADPLVAEQLREAQQQLSLPEALRFKGITPEMRAVYDLVAQQSKEFQAALRPRRDEERLRDALQLGGGELRGVHDRGGFWLVEWTTRDGERHTSAIGKRDLTVISAGICLSGGDRAFDLQSLVGVVERQW
jgi:hypothetical protein